MINLQSLRSKIDERLKREMVPAFLDKYERWHKRKGLRSCDCDYCVIKRQATIDIGSGRKHIPLPNGKRFVDPVSFEMMVEHSDGSIKTLSELAENSREALRVKYRQKLKASAESI